jgi:bifunctional DNase/RNase
MSKEVIPVKVRAVLPINSGRAVFIGNPSKVFVIYVDDSVGNAIAMFLSQTPKERPQTHDLIGHLLTALGAKVDRVIINDLVSETYFARIIVSAENELLNRKIIELDARPSDSIALAIQQNAPIYVTQDVWDEVEDRSDVLKSLEPPNPPDSPDSSSAA